MWALVRQRAFWAGLLAGVLVGLFLGWVVWPVHYTDAFPSELKEEHRLEYLRLVARDYYYTNKPEPEKIALLSERLQTFDQKDLVPLLEKALQTYESEEDKQALRHTLETIRASQAAAPAGQGQPAAPTPTPTPRAQASPAGRGFPLTRIFSLALIVIGVAVLAFVLIRVLPTLQGHVREAPPAPAGTDWAPGPITEVPPEAEPEFEEEEAPVSTASVQVPPHLQREGEEGPPVSVSPRPEPKPPAAPSLRLVEVFAPSFLLQTRGEEGFDEAFTVYEDEENLGECGVGEAEPLPGREGQPIAMEVWLFDKHDSVTHQAYILSPWAYRQPDIRQNFEDRGTVVVGQHGNVVRLSARTLYLEAEIKDVAYAQVGEGDEVFGKLAVEMKVYRRIVPRGDEG